MDHPVRNERGFTLIEVMIGAGLSAFIVTGLITAFLYFSESFNLAVEQTAMRKIRTYILQELNRPDSWVTTYLNNSDFSCLYARDPVGTCLTDSANERSFVLYGRNVVIVYDPTAVPMNGFTFKGAACTGWTSAGTGTCAIRLNLTWRLVNWGGDNFPTGYMPFGYYPTHLFPPSSSATYYYFGRITAQVEVRGRFEINDINKRKINPSRYDFTIYKNVP